MLAVGLAVCGGNCDDKSVYVGHETAPSEGIGASGR
jgi:hypothetical protein